MSAVDDKLAIFEVIARYAHAWDGGDSDAYAACFTEDGVFEDYLRARPEPITRKAGRAAILEWARGIHGDAQPPRRTRHAPINTVFDELTESTARTRTMLLDTLLRPEDGAPWVANTGVYIDAWRNTPEGWRLARREVHHDRTSLERPRDVAPPMKPLR